MKVDDTVDPGQIEGLRPARALLRGVATMLDFAGGLAHRSQTQSVDDDMAIAWQEVLGVGRPPQGIQSDEGAPTGRGGSEPDEAEVSSRRPARPVIGKGRSSSPDPNVEVVAYRGPTAAVAAGITYRQLDYFARTALVEPSVRVATGSGSQRLYSFRDILTLKVVKRLLDTGIPLGHVRAAVDYLRAQGVGDITHVTLMSDGVSVYACTSPEEVVDLLQGGQGVFGIALGRIWHEVEGTLADLPQEPGILDEPDHSPQERPQHSPGEDERSERRRGNHAG
jgi:DNA-binding transcriptional MerR regulator